MQQTASAFPELGRSSHGAWVRTRRPAGPPVPYSVARFFYRAVLRAYCTEHILTIAIGNRRALNTRAVLAERPLQVNMGELAGPVERGGAQLVHERQHDEALRDEREHRKQH